MIRRVRWATDSYTWDTDDVPDADVLDPRTAAVLDFGEKQLAHSLMLRADTFTRQELAASTMALYLAKRRALALLDQAGDRPVPDGGDPPPS